MSIKKIDHLFIESPKFDESLSFWKKLGFEVSEEWGHDDYRACKLKSGQTLIVLTNSNSDSKAPSIFLETKDTDSYYQKLKDSGVEIVSPLAKTHWQTKCFKVKDPDGNVFCLEESNK